MGGSVAPGLAVAAAIVATVVNVQEFKRRWLSTQFAVELLQPWWRALNAGVVLLLGAVATGLAFAIDPLVMRLVDAGTAGRVVVAGVGLGLGLAGFGFLGLGAGVHALFWSADTEFLVFWVVPLVGGAAVRFLHIGGLYRRSAWRFALDVTHRGMVIGTPAYADPFWRVAGLLAGMAPLAGLLFVSSPDDRADLYGCYGGALLVIVQSAWIGWRAREIAHRWLRLLWTATGALTRLLVVGVAAGPAGALCAELWRRVPVLTGVGGGLIIAAAATALWAVPTLTEYLGRWLPGRSRLVLNLIRLPLVGGLLPVSVAIFHPHAGLAAAAFVLAAAETASLFAGRDRGVLDQLTAAAGPLIIDPSAAKEESQFGRWLRDAVVGRPAHPEYALIRSLNARAARAARGETGGDPARRAGLDASCWNDLAERLLDLVDGEVAPRHPVKHRARLTAAQDVARADTAWSWAIVQTHAGAWAGAERRWRDAATRHMLLGHANHELFARVMVVLLLALYLDRPAEAERQAARLARSSATHPALRGCVSLAKAAEAHTRGDDRAAGALLDCVSDVSARRFRAAWADDPHQGRLERWSPEECARIVAACEAQLRASIAEKGVREEPLAQGAER